MLVLLCCLLRLRRGKGKKRRSQQVHPFLLNVTAHASQDGSKDDASLDGKQSFITSFMHALPTLNSGGWTSKLRRGSGFKNGRLQKIQHSPSSSLEMDFYNKPGSFKDTATAESLPYSMLANAPTSPLESPPIAMSRPTKEQLLRGHTHRHNRSLSTESLVFLSYASHYSDSPVDPSLPSTMEPSTRVSPSQHLSASLLSNQLAASHASHSHTHSNSHSLSPSSHSNPNVSPTRRPAPTVDPAAAFAAVIAYAEAEAVSPLSPGSAVRRTRPLPVPNAIQVGLPLPLSDGKTPPSSGRPPPYQMIDA